MPDGLALFYNLSPRHGPVLSKLRQHIDIRVICVIEWDLGKFRLRFTFSFFALVGLVCAIGESIQLRLCVILLCALMHELGHIAAMLMFGLFPDTMTFCAGGISLSENVLHCSRGRRAVILLAGCAVDFVCAAVSLMLGFFGTFAATHLILGAFNLMPFRYFDGGRLYSELTGRELPRLLRLAALTPLAVLTIYCAAHGQLPLSLAAAMTLMLIDG